MLNYSHVFVVFFVTEKLAELSNQFQGPAGPAGVGKPGKQGFPGAQGIPGNISVGLLNLCQLI